MELIYNLCAFIVGIGVPLLVVCLFASLIRPHLLNSRIKKEWSRRRIFTLGIAAILITLVGFSSVMAATEPESIKAERLAKQQAVEKAKREAEERARNAQIEAERAKEAEASIPETKTLKEVKAIEFSTVRKDDGSLPKGEERISVKGATGERTTTYEVTYVKGVETSRKITGEEVTKTPVDEVILVGTYVEPVRQSFSSQQQSTAASVYYTNCSAARAAGAAPVYIGQPGYGRHLDRDNDGIGCE